VNGVLVGVGTTTGVSVFVGVAVGGRGVLVAVGAARMIRVPSTGTSGGLQPTTES
jgi:hypothetical protein